VFNITVCNPSQFAHWCF